MKIKRNMDQYVAELLWLCNTTQRSQLNLHAEDWVVSEGNKSEARHMFWCKMRQAEMLGLPYTEKPVLPRAVQDAIKHIFQDFISIRIAREVSSR